MNIYTCIHIYLDIPKGALDSSGTGCKFSIFFFGLSGTPWKVHRCFFHGLDVTSDTFVVGEGQNHSDGGQSGTGQGHRDPV